ncbi:MAG: F0F1 ATP synthase subunit B [Phycisphaeraceae bacterium]
MTNIWRTGIGCTAALGTLAAATPALAAENPALLNWEPGEYVWSLLVFLGLLAILLKFVWPPILNGLQTRETKIRGDIEAAEKANRDAQQALAQYKQQLADTRREAQHMIDQSRTEAARAGAQLKEQAQADIAQMRKRAEQDIRNAKEQAVAELYEQTATLATQVAGQILRREISAKDQQALVEQSLSKLAEAPRA